MIQKDYMENASQAAINNAYKATMAKREKVVLFENLTTTKNKLSNCLDMLQDCMERAEQEIVKFLKIYHTCEESEEKSVRYGNLCYGLDLEEGIEISLSGNDTLITSIWVHGRQQDRVVLQTEDGEEMMLTNIEIDFYDIYTILETIQAMMFTKMIENLN